MATARDTFRLLALWGLCSVVALVLLVLVKILSERLIVASKLEEIGVWGIYVGIALEKLTELMLAPVTASRMVGLPEWLDFAAGLTVVGGWGIVGVVAIRWARRRFAGDRQRRPDSN